MRLGSIHQIAFVDLNFSDFWPHLKSLVPRKEKKLNLLVELCDLVRIQT